jgi:transposase-like protein
MMTKISYSGYRFPPEIIQPAIWLYLRFTLSFRDVEDLLAECGILVSHETRILTAGGSSSLCVLDGQTNRQHPGA